MTDLRRLSELNTLREAGALTSGEFEQEKAKLLSSKKFTRMASLAVALTLILGAVALWLLLPLHSADPSNPTATAGPAATQAADGVWPSSVAQSAQPGEDVLKFATSNEVIGINPAYLETKLGTPREKSNWRIVFDVSGCRISYDLENKEVTSFETDIDQRCHPTIGGVRITPQTTYGQLLHRDSVGGYVASCLTDCGNAADPTIDLSYPGSRATTFISIDYSADFDQVASALERWEQAVRQIQGLGPTDTAADFDTFMCVTDPPSDVLTLLANVKVTSVRVSRRTQAC